MVWIDEYCWKPPQLQKPAPTRKASNGQGRVGGNGGDGLILEPSLQTEVPISSENFHSQTCWAYSAVLRCWTQGLELARQVLWQLSPHQLTLSFVTAIFSGRGFVLAWSQSHTAIHLPSLLHIYWDGVSLTFCPVCLWTRIFLISASQVVGISHMSHCVQPPNVAIVDLYVFPWRRSFNCISKKPSFAVQLTYFCHLSGTPSWAIYNQKRWGLPPLPFSPTFLSSSLPSRGDPWIY
jgi:hypothetical protein